MDEREPDSTGRPLTRRELRERAAAAASAADEPGVEDAEVPAEPTVEDAEVAVEPGVEDAAAPAEPGVEAAEVAVEVEETVAPAPTEVDWGSKVRWSLHHELPALVPDEPDEDDVRWEPVTPPGGTSADLPQLAPDADEEGAASAAAPERTGEEDAAAPAPVSTPGQDEATTVLPQVPPATGGVPRRRSVWLMGQPDAAVPPVPPVPDAPVWQPVPEPGDAGVRWEPDEPAVEAMAQAEHDVAFVPQFVPRDVEPHGEEDSTGADEPEPPTATAVEEIPEEQPDAAEVPQALEPAVPAPLPTLSDLLAARPDPAAGPAQLGWQGVVRRMTGGLLRLRPGPTEQAHREAVAAVQRHLDGPRTIVVINPKGGAHKTTGTLLLAAAFGQHRGGYTLAWDNNETRGTLGWRSMPGTHQRTAVDLLQNLDRFSEGGAARVGDLDSYVRSQGSAQFDVLASDEDAASAASIDSFAFRALHRTLSRFYRVMIVDTGNNMRASNWQAAIEAADQVVIVSTVREDTAQSAAWAIDALRATGHAEVVRNAVTVLSDPAPQRDSALAARLHEHFGQLTRAVVDVPYDASLVGGSPLLVEHLDRRTREAWLRVAAVVAEGL